MYTPALRSCIPRGNDSRPSFLLGLRNHLKLPHSSLILWPVEQAVRLQLAGLLVLLASSTRNRGNGARVQRFGFGVGGRVLQQRLGSSSPVSNSGR